MRTRLTLGGQTSALSLGLLRYQVGSWPLSCIIPVMPKCITGYRPSPDKVIQNLCHPSSNANPADTWLACHAHFAFPLTSCYSSSCYLFGELVMIYATCEDDTVFLCIDGSDLVPLAGVFNKFPSSFNFCNSLAIAWCLTMNLPGSSGMSAVVDVEKIQGFRDRQRLSLASQKTIIDRLWQCDNLLCQALGHGDDVTMMVRSIWALKNSFRISLEI